MLWSFSNTIKVERFKLVKAESIEKHRKPKITIQIKVHNSLHQY